MKIKLSDYVFAYIAELKVKHVFLLSGGGCMHLVDSLGRNRDLEYITCLHEQAAGIAACAYSQYTNHLGVVLVTTGPGGTNAVTAAAAAWTDSIPLLVLSGQVKKVDMALDSGMRTLGYQEIDIISIVKPITKYAVTVMNPQEIRYHLKKAVMIAKSGRPGPVWLDIPLDVQASMIDTDQLTDFSEKELTGQAGLSNPDIRKDQILKTVELMNQAERPVILAGYGIKLAHADQDFLKLIETLKIPVLTTWKAMDLLTEDHPFYYGRPGCIGQRPANFIQQNADLIITIGARLDFGQIGYAHETFAREAKKIVIEIDPAEFKKFKFTVDLAVTADAAVYIKGLLENIKSVAEKDRSAWLSRCQDWKRKYPVVLDLHRNQQKYTSTYTLVDFISELSQPGMIFAPGNSGACSEVFMQAFRVKEGQQVIGINGLGAMGTGLPASIGACIAGGRQKTVCINGDGGLQLNIQELETIARLKLPIKIFVLNNNGYGSIRNTQKNYFNNFLVASDSSSGVTMPNIVDLARAYKIKAERIADNTDLGQKIKGILDDDGPVICEVMVDPAEPTMPRVTSQLKPDGTMVSKPLEDLWPFLDRNEFKANMIVKPVEE